MSFLRTIGPASIEVWISSPVRSRKPVLMKTTRSRAARMHALRLTVVRRSSSMMPILSVWRGRPSSVLDAPEQLVGEGDLVGAVHLRLDDVDRARAAVAQRSRGHCRSCIATSAVTAASRMPSGISVAGRRRAPRRCTCGGRRCARASGCGRAGVSVAAVRARVDPVGVEPALDARGRPSRSCRSACRSSGRASCGRPRPCPRRRRRRRCPRRSMMVEIGGFQHDVGDAGRIVLADRARRGRSRSRCAGRCAAAAIAGACGVARDSRRTAPGRARPVPPAVLQRHRERAVRRPRRRPRRRGSPRAPAAPPRRGTARARATTAAPRAGL